RPACDVRHDNPRRALYPVGFDITREVPMGMLRQASLFALLTLILDFVPLVMAAVYVIRPTERHLAMMRPLPLARPFAPLSGGVRGFITVLRLVWTRELTAETYRVMAVGAAESLVSLFVGFASLIVAWLLVAVGMGRQGARLRERSEEATSELHAHSDLVCRIT